MNKLPFSWQGKNESDAIKKKHPYSHICIYFLNDNTGGNLQPHDKTSKYISNKKQKNLTREPLSI